MRLHLRGIFLIGLIIAFAANATEPETKSKISEPNGKGLIQSNRHVRNPLDNVYLSTDVPVDIPDNGNPGISELLVPDSFLIGDVNVFVNISHTYDNDLIIILEAPLGGGTDTLFNRRGADGDNIYQCTFDDEAENPISEGEAPFNGEWRPDEPLSDFDGINCMWAWYLAVYDVAAIDSGTILSWGLEITDAAESVHENSPIVIRGFDFHAAYPNPFNASTTFSFDLARAGTTNLVLYDLLGRETAEIFSGLLGAGTHEIHFNATDLPSGNYVARLSDGHEYQSQRVILLK